MKSDKVKVKVNGYIEMSQENLDRLLSQEDPHTSLLYSLHMGYVDAGNILFDPQK